MAKGAQPTDTVRLTLRQARLDGYKAAEARKQRIRRG